MSTNETARNQSMGQHFFAVDVAIFVGCAKIKIQRTVFIRNQPSKVNFQTNLLNTDCSFLHRKYFKNNANSYTPAQLPAKMC